MELAGFDSCPSKYALKLPAKPKPRDNNNESVELCSPVG